MIIDVHTHIFPDELAARAMGSLVNTSGDYKPFGDGTLANLLAMMDRSGIEQAWVANIATKPSQSAPILEWSKSIRSERIIPLCSVHPESPNRAEELARFREAGFAGIKLHPMYQEFNLDDPDIITFFREIAQSGMFVLTHAGADIAYPGADNASPRRLSRLLERVDGLDLIAAHLGGWEVWDEVLADLAGANCWFDISFLPHIEPSVRDRIIHKQGAGRLLFGSDFPWQDPVCLVSALNDIGLAESDLSAILSGNARDLLARHAV